MPLCNRNGFVLHEDGLDTQESCYASHTQGLEIEESKESPESLFSINVADTKKQTKK